jgi:hypothetical protein
VQRKVLYRKIHWPEFEGKVGKRQLKLRNEGREGGRGELCLLCFVAADFAGNFVDVHSSFCFGTSVWSGMKRYLIASQSETIAVHYRVAEEIGLRVTICFGS